MSKVMNSEYKPHRGLGESDADWDLLKDKIRTYLRTNAGDSTVEVEDVRELDPKLRDDRIWIQIAADMGLVEIPG